MRAGPAHSRSGVERLSRRRAVLTHRDESGNHGRPHDHQNVHDDNHPFDYVAPTVSELPVLAKILPSDRWTVLRSQDSVGGPVGAGQPIFRVSPTEGWAHAGREWIGDRLSLTGQNKNRDPHERQRLPRHRDRRVVDKSSGRRQRVPTMRSRLR